MFGQKVSWVNFLNWLQHCQYSMFGCLGRTSSYTENYATGSERSIVFNSLIYTTNGWRITTFVRTSPNPYDLHIPYLMQHHFESVHVLYHPSLGLQPASCRSSPLRTFLAVSSSRLYLRTATCLVTNELVHKQLNGSPDIIELGGPNGGKWFSVHQ